MFLDRRNVILRSAALLAVAWCCLFTERINTDFRFVDGRIGDSFGVLGAILVAIAVVYAASHVRLSGPIRWIVFAGLALFVLWTLSDTLDEFRYFDGNPVFGSNQPLHLFLESLLLTSAGICAWTGFIFALIETERARLRLAEETRRAEDAAEEHRRTRDELRIFSDAMEHSHDAVFIADVNGVISYINAASERIFGYSRTEVLGRNASYFVENAPVPVNVQAIIVEIMTYGGWTGELELLRKNGAVFVASLTASAILDASNTPVGIQTVVRDVTEQRRLESALRASEELHRLLADNATDLISSHDIHGTFMYASPACEALLGYTTDELVGRSVTEFLHPGDAEVFDDLVRGPRSREAVTLNYRARRKDGAYVFFESTLRHIVSEETGEIAEVIAVSRDVSQRLREEEARRRLEERVRRTQRQESLGVLAGGVAHDYNNLLLSIMANAELAQLGIAEDSPGAPHLQKIITATERAAELTRQMLAYSGQGHLSSERIDLSALVSEMVHLLETAISKKVRLHRDLPPDLPKIVGDATQLRQVVMNLITNASEATEASGGSILIRTGLMHCSTAYLADTVLHENLPGGNYVYLEVSDTGAGMDAETCVRIFDPFFTTKFAGRGLGLAALLGIVGGHRGAVEVKSEVGQGTVFRVLIPAATAEQAADTPGAEAGQVGTP